MNGFVEWSTYGVVFAILLVGYVAFFMKKIDAYGALLGVLLAFSIYFFTGSMNLLALLFFFILGTMVSSWQKQKKADLKLAQENEGTRTVANVIGNGGAAGFFALLAIFPAMQEVCSMMVFAFFSTACSDTFSSEIGNIYGSKYFNILTLKADKRGKDGTISYEGLLAGIVGSFSIAILSLGFGYELRFIVAITIIGFAGNLVDSILGATLQQKGILNNHQVNFFATLSGGLIFGFANLYL